MKKIIISILIILSNNLFANALTTVKVTNDLFIINGLSKITKLINITEKDFRLGMKSDNISMLLNLAQKENRVSYPKSISYAQTFQAMKNGDTLLLNCLNKLSCNLEIYTDILGKSSLHKYIIINNPILNLPQVNHAVGSINENLMNRYFQSTGWTKIEGEVGRNGIDGLFIKRNRNNQIIDVLVCESKYNTSGLQHTKSGLQMTNQWVVKKIENLQKHYPNNQDYDVIHKFVKNGSYRSLLWNLKVNNDLLTISLKKLHDKEGNIFKSELIGPNKMKINFKDNETININSPQNKFHKDIILWYKQELKRAML